MSERNLDFFFLNKTLVFAAGLNKNCDTASDRAELYQVMQAFVMLKSCRYNPSMKYTFACMCVFMNTVHLCI